MGPGWGKKFKKLFSRLHSEEHGFTSYVQNLIFFLNQLQRNGKPVLQFWEVISIICIDVNNLFNYVY